MKKTTIGIIVVLVIAIIIGFSAVGSRNTLVSMAEEVDLAAAQIQAQLQRRHDLIPNLVATVKGYANHEESVYTEIAEARSKLGGAVKSGDLAAMEEADKELDGALSRLLVITESYPELKADKSFIALQDALEGTENRIGHARNEYNEVVKEYNKAIKMFPKSIIANMCGLEPAEYFQADEDAQDVPVVEF